MPAYAVVLVAVVVVSFPRQTGDAHDYVAMSHNLSHGRPPALSQADLVEIRGYFARWRSGYEVEPALFIRPQLLGGDGRYELQHFWFYPALVAPFLVVTNGLALHPNYAFTFVNLCLLLVAAAVVSRRLHWSLTALLFLGPIVWWVDKAQVEVFIFSLLAIAMVCVRERPWWSFLCIGAAATANPVIAGALVIVAGASVLSRRAWLRSRAFWAGAIVGFALAALYPIYYLLRIDRLTPVLNTRTDLPTVGEIRFPLVDLNYGLLFNFPIFPLTVLAVLAVVVRRDPRRLLEVDVLVAAAIVPLFLVGVAETTLFAHGGTPGPSRYALWFIPLAIPLLSRAQELGRLSRLGRSWFIAVAAMTAAWGLTAFNARRGEAAAMKPTPVAAFVWKHWPRLDNPLAQVFSTRISHQFGLRPAATSSCSKVLVVSDQWPARCAIGKIPARCLRLACYANRSGGGYIFAEAPLPKGTEASLARSGAASPPPGLPTGGIRLRTNADRATVRILPGQIRYEGRRVPIESGAVLGSVDQSEDLGTTAVFSGWAASLRDRRPADKVLVFADDRFVGEIEPTISRPDVAKALRAPVEQSGYIFWLPIEFIKDGQMRSRLKVVALEGRVASILAFICAGDKPRDWGC